MKSKQSNTESLIKELIEGRVTIKDILNKIKFIFTPDKEDASILDASTYLKAHEPRRVEKIEKKKKKKIEAEPEVSEPILRLISRTPLNGTFSIGDRSGYELLQKQLEQELKIRI